MAELEEPPHSELRLIKGNPDASSQLLYVIELQLLTLRLGSKQQGEGENHCSFESESCANRGACVNPNSKSHSLRIRVAGGGVAHL